MQAALRYSFLALYALGPAVALVALRRRRQARGSAVARHYALGWRRYVPAVLLPFEWLQPPALIISGFGEVQANWLPVRFLGLALGLGGAALLVCAALALGRFFVHAAAVAADHSLVASGPYRLVRHPVYAGYLALLLGSGLGTLNVCLLLLWPISLAGIWVQAESEERLLMAKLGDDFRRYAARTGRFVPKWQRAVPGQRATAPDGPPAV